MHKVKYGAVLLFAVLLIVLGAFLPSLAAKWQDSASAGKVRYGDMDTVRLTIRDAEETDPEKELLTDAEKLAFLTQKSLDISEVQEGLTKMTPEEVRLAAEAALQPYIERELILTESSGLTFSCLPFLYYAESDPGTFNIVWDVTMTNQDLSQGISLIIDDETGKPLRINYAAEGIYEGRELTSIVPILSSLYFAPLDLLTSNAYSVSYDDGASECYTVISAGETVEKAVDLEFYVYSDGFFTRLN